MNKPYAPNLFILGPPRTASTSLAFWLGQHPDIFISEPKETLFFESEYENGINFYLHKYFRHHAGEKIICDARPMNSIVKYVPERIKEICDNPKFIITIRDPLERAYSEWRNWRDMRPGRAHDNFNDAIACNVENFSLSKFKYEFEYVPFTDSRGGCYITSYIEGGLYYNIAKPYVDLFGIENIMFIKFGHLLENKKYICNKIFRFLNIDKFNFIDYSKRNMFSPQKIKNVKTKLEISKELSNENLSFFDDKVSKDKLRLSALINYEY